MNCIICWTANEEGETNSKECDRKLQTVDEVLVEKEKSVKHKEGNRQILYRRDSEPVAKL